MDRQQKHQFVEDFSRTVSENELVVLLKVQALNAVETANLRSTLKMEAGASLQYVKNSLARLALGKTEYASLESHCSGPVAFVYGPDLFLTLKTTLKFAKTNKKVELVAAALRSGELHEDMAHTLGKFSSLEELKASFLGLLQSAPRHFLGVLQAYAEKGGSAGSSQSNN